MLLIMLKNTIFEIQKIQTHFLKTKQEIGKTIKNNYSITKNYRKPKH